MKIYTFLILIVVTFYISIEIYAWSSSNPIVSASQTLDNLYVNFGFMNVKKHFFINRIIYGILIVLLILSAYIFLVKPRLAIVPLFISLLITWNGGSIPAFLLFTHLLNIYNEPPYTNFEWFYNELRAPELLWYAILFSLGICFMSSLFALYRHKKA